MPGDLQTAKTVEGAEGGVRTNDGAPAAPGSDGSKPGGHQAGDDDGARTAAILQMLLTHTVEFSKSGFFFILLGIGFLYFAYRSLDHVHSSFVFILALLGLSIVLFGTGTQSLGSGEFTQPASQARAKVYLAGGAGVLAGIFGFGAVIGEQQIQHVFSDPGGYALVKFKIDNPAGSNLRRATVSARLEDGRQLPLVINENDESIETYAPVSRGNKNVVVCINAESVEPKWTIESTCPLLTLTDNASHQRPEPVQSLGFSTLLIKYVNKIGLEEGGKSISQTNFIAQ